MKKLWNEHFIITMFFSFMLFTIIMTLFFVDLPQENINLINIALGFIAGAVTAQNSYFFGDTDSLKQVRKDENINK